MDKALEAIRENLRHLMNAANSIGRERWLLACQYRDAILAELATLEKRELKPGPNYIETETTP